MTIFKVSWKIDGHAAQNTLISTEKLAQGLRDTLTAAAAALKAHFEIPPQIDKVDVQ